MGARSKKLLSEASFAVGDQVMVFGVTGVVETMAHVVDVQVINGKIRYKVDSIYYGLLPERRLMHYGVYADRTDLGT